MSRFGQGILAILAIIFLSGAISSNALAQVVNFSYEQTDNANGSGMFFGQAGGFTFSGEMPLASVTQNDLSDRSIPAGMIGYIDGASSASPGNDYGVHLGWSGTTTVKATRVVSATLLEFYDIEVDLTIGEDGSPADWSFEAIVTDDDGSGNDAFGSLRMAAFVGDPLDGHRHSGGTQAFAEGVVDTFTMGGTHAQVDENGRGDELGIGISFRDGPEEWAAGDLFESGPVFVDNVIWNGALNIDLSSAEATGTGLPSDFDGDGNVGLSDFLIFRENFNTDGTTRLTGDLNTDGRTDLYDFVFFREAFGTSGNVANAASVPEPATSLLLISGAFLLAMGRRRRAP